MGLYRYYLPAIQAFGLHIRLSGRLSACSFPISRLPSSQRLPCRPCFAWLGRAQPFGLRRGLGGNPPCFAWQSFALSGLRPDGCLGSASQMGGQLRCPRESLSKLSSLVPTRVALWATWPSARLLRSPQVTGPLGRSLGLLRKQTARRRRLRLQGIDGRWQGSSVATPPRSGLPAKGAFGSQGLTDSTSCSMASPSHRRWILVELALRWLRHLRPALPPSVRWPGL